LINVDSTLF